MIAQAAVHQNPFPGLRPFREDEERFFFGRENQVNTMVNELARTRFLAVLGTSGSGKSSLVNCGLRPALHRGLMAGAGPAWRMAQFRPGSDPIQSLAEALAAEGVLYSKHNEDVPIAEIVKTYLHASKNGIVETFRKARLPEGTNLLIVADQFEELFRYRKLQSADSKEDYSINEDTIAFVNLLLEAHEQSDCPIYVVITMRSDFLGDCSQFYGLPEAINGGQYLVPRMTRDERRASIAGPVSVGGAEISSVLLTRLVNDVGNNPDQLSILQHALNRTWACWEHHGAKGELELDHYKLIGTMAQALNQHADEAYDQLGTPEKKKICEKIFKALTDLGTDARGIRRPLKLATLTEIAGPGTEQQVKEVIEFFREPSRSFLMPPASEPLEPEKVIDISHESLMRIWKRLRGWAEEEAISARRYRRLADTAELAETGKARLRDPDLQVALDWREEQVPTAAWANPYGGNFDLAISFLERSQSDRDHELAEEIFARRWNRFRRIIILLIAGIFLWRFQAGDFDSWSEIFGYKRSTVTETTTEDLHNLASQLKTHERSSTNAIENLKQTAQSAHRAGAFTDYCKLLLTVTFFLAPYFLGYLALAYSGKWVFRRVGFARILQEVALSSSKAARTQKLSKESLRDAAAIKLQTTYAGFGRRLGAYVLDLGLFMLGLVLFFVGWIQVINPLERLGSWETYIIYGLLFLPFVLDWLYETMMLGSRARSTLGMRALGIFVTDRNGERLHFGRATAWHFARFLSYFTLGIGFLFPPSARKQLLHDVISGSVVLVKPGKKVQGWLVVVCLILGLVEVIPLGYFLLFVGVILIAWIS